MEALYQEIGGAIQSILDLGCGKCSFALVFSFAITSTAQSFQFGIGKCILWD